jgi:long-subunit fatty acid transport protein
MRFSLLAGLVLAACCLPARADQFNHKIVLVGDKGAALGGAFAGLADDATATYYNPAGLTQTKNVKLNVSAQLVQYQKQKIGIAEGTDIPYNSFNFSPTITSFSQRMGNWAYGFSVVTPMNDLFTGEQKIEGAYHDEAAGQWCSSAPGADDPCFARLNLSYYDVSKSTMVGPSLALKYSDRVSLGLSVYAIYNTELEKTAFGGWDGNFVGGDPEDLSRFHESNVTRSVTQTGLGGTAMIGGLIRLENGFSIGLNLSPGSMVWVSRVEEQRVEEIWNDTTVTERTNSGTGALAIYNTTGKEKHTEVTAPSLSLAVSWKPLEILLLTAQTDYYLGSQYTYTGMKPDHDISKQRSGFEYYAPLEQTYTIKKNAVADFSGGFEVQILKGYSLACGGFTDFSQGPDDDRPASWDRNIDYYGFTVSLGMDKDLTQSRFGVSMAYGDASITHFQWGKSAGGRYTLLTDPVSGELYRPRQSFDAYNLGVFLSSTLKI